MQVNVDIKIKWKEKIGFVVVFISKSPGSYAIYRRNARVFEMQNFMPAYMKGWSTSFPHSQNFLDAEITKFVYPWCSAAGASMRAAI